MYAHFGKVVSTIAYASLFLVFLCALPAGAQTNVPNEDFDTLAQQWTRTLNDVESELARSHIAVKWTNALRQRLAQVRASVMNAREQAQPNAQSQRRLLDTLGPLPAEAEPPDDEAVAAERAHLARKVAQYEGQLKRCDMAEQRVITLLDRIAQVEVAIIFFNTASRRCREYRMILSFALSFKLSQRVTDSGRQLS